MKKIFKQVPLPFQMLDSVEQPQMPLPQETIAMPSNWIDYKSKSMPYHVYTFKDRDGRQRERVFPQSPYQSDFKAQKFETRFLTGCHIQGIVPTLEVVPRAAYHKTVYKSCPYSNTWRS
jgi:hypothetical protein